MQERVRVHDRLGKRRSADRLGAGRRGDRTSSEKPERLVEARDEADAEAGGERRPRLADQLADALQAEPVEERILLAADPERGDRKIGDRLGLRTRKNSAARAVMRKRPGGAGGGGDGAAHLKTLARETVKEVGEERFFAVIMAMAGEKMRAAGDVEEQAVRKIERDERRIAVAPVGELFEERMVGRLVGLGHDEIGDGAACIGKGGAQADSPPLGNFVDCDDANRALDFFDDGERRF